MSKAVYSLKLERKLTAPNGKTIIIWAEADKHYVQLTHIYKALGFTGQFGTDTTLGLVCKNKNFQYFIKQAGGNSTYVIELNKLIPLLEAFIRLSHSIQSSKYQMLRDNACMEAQRLIELFNREVFKKSDAVKKSVEPPSEKTGGKCGIITSFHIAELVKIIRNIPPHNTTICIYKVNHGTETEETVIPVRNLTTAIYGNNFTDEQEHMLYSAVRQIGIPEYQIYHTDTLELGIATFEVSDVLIKFTELENYSYAYNANILYSSLAEYDYFAFEYISQSLLDFLQSKFPFVQSFFENSIRKLAALEREFNTTKVINAIYTESQIYPCGVKEFLLKGEDGVFEYIRDFARNPEQATDYIEHQKYIIEQTTTANADASKEDIQMENNMATVPAVTVEDFNDINERADIIAKIFGSAKKDALRVAVKLKAQEMNRDLSPCLELLE